MVQNKMKIVVVVVVLILILVAIFFGKQWGVGNDDYSVVYLTTGEVYVGELSTFPDLQLKNGYILQITKDTEDPNKNSFQLNPIKDAVWAPKSLHLVKDSVVFYGPLAPESTIAKTLAEQMQ